MTATNFDSARKRIWDEIVILHDTWSQYRYLYGESAERVQMLNACAGWFFGVTQRALLREVILGISRLTDPPGTGKSANLVVDSLLNDPELDQHEGLRAQLVAAIALAKDAAKDVRVHRNKYIAHLDHATVRGAALPGLQTDAIAAAIKGLEDIYNAHGSTVRGSQAFFDVATTGDAKALVRILEQSERWIRWKAIHNERNGKSNEPVP